MAVTVLDVIDEGTTGLYTAVLKDEAGVIVPAASLTAARLTLVSMPSNVILRSGQNVLNNVAIPEITISALGVLSWKLLEADVTLVEPGTVATVKHRATFVLEWVDAGGTARQLTHAVEIPIRRLRNAPLTV